MHTYICMYIDAECKPAGFFSVTASGGGSMPASFTLQGFVCGCRVPVVQGRNHDFGAEGKLLVCDATGAYLVDVGCGPTTQVLGPSFNP